MFGTMILEERESKYNGHLKVVRSLGFGTYIQAEGLTQSGGIVESIWRSTLHRVKGERQEVKEALVLGLGGGTVARLIRKNWPKAKIVGVDIDPAMVELGRKYLKLHDSKVKTIIADALQYMKYNIRNTKYDLVIVDLYNGDKYPEKFETENYMHLVRNILARSGVVVFNRLYYGDKRPMAVKFGNKLQKVFSKVGWFYPDVNLMFLCHS